MEPLVASGLLTGMKPESEQEANTYVDFAAELDDGQAMTCALAIHRGCAIATDERKTIRILGERAPQVAIRTTATLLRWWAEVGHVGPQVVRLALRAIQVRGRFRPGKTDPLLSWWESILRQAATFRSGPEQVVVDDLDRLVGADLVRSACAPLALQCQHDVPSCRSYTLSEEGHDNRAGGDEFTRLTAGATRCAQSAPTGGVH